LTQEYEAVSKERKVLEQSSIEQKVVIKDLKDTLKMLLTPPTDCKQVQTDETSAALDGKMSGISLFLENYQDLYPQLTKSGPEVKKNTLEFSYSDSTILDILAECGFGITTAMLNHHQSATTDTKDSPSKKSFDWSFFKKLTGQSSAEEGPKTLEQQATEASPRTPLIHCTPEGSKADREWEKEVITPVSRHGDPISLFTSRMNAMNRSGNAVPWVFRGLVWRKLIGNKSRITPRIFTMLLPLLPKANPAVLELIIQDVDRAFPDYSRSPTFTYIKSESIKILQLFEVLSHQQVHRPDIGFISGMSFIAIALRMNMSTYHAFKAFVNLIFSSNLLYANYTFDTRKVDPPHPAQHLQQSIRRPLSRDRAGQALDTPDLEHRAELLHGQLVQDALRQPHDPREPLQAVGLLLPQRRRRALLARPGHLQKDRLPQQAASRNPHSTDGARSSGD